MSEMSKLEILKASPLAREMTTQECEALAGLIDIYDLKDGEVLLREGQSDNNLYGVVSGVIAVARQDPQDSWHALHQLGPGDFVGELSFMDNEPRYAALRAQGPTRACSRSTGSDWRRCSIRIRASSTRPCAPSCAWCTPSSAA